MSGYVIAVLSMILATFMFIYSAHRLLECWKVESDRNHRMAARMEEEEGRVRTLLERSTDDNDDNNEQAEPFTPALLTYPELASRAFGPSAFIVELGIALMQFGVCLTYLIFVPQNLQECVRTVTGHEISRLAFLVAMLLVEIPLGWIADIRKLTPTNVMATILIAYGLLSVLGLAFATGFSTNEEGRLVLAQNLAALPAWTDAWFLFVGTSFFMMEGSITLVVPLQEAIFLKEDRAKFPAINQTVTSWIVVFYIAFSFICIAAFGDGVQTAMTASLKGALATTVQLAYSFAVILTFPLQSFPAMQVAAKAILGEGTRQQGSAVATTNYSRSVLSTVLILLLGLIAVVAIDYLGNVVSILGSLFGVPLALIFPPLMHHSLIKDSTSATKWMNFLIVGIGFLAMGATSFATIVSWDKGAER
jgi:proton-coupled amino acid transporter